MIYAGLSDILYPGGTLGEFMYRVRAFAVRLRRVTLYTDNV